MKFFTVFPFDRFKKFFITSLTGTIADTLTLWVLASYVFDFYVGIYIIAPTISFEVAVFNNYIQSYFWIWDEKVGKTRRDFFVRFIAYNVNSSLIFFLKLGLLLIVELLTGLHVVYCNLIALCFTGIINFLLQNHLIFAKSFQKNRTDVMAKKQDEGYT